MELAPVAFSAACALHMWVLWSWFDYSAQYCDFVDQYE